MIQIKGLTSYQPRNLLRGLKWILCGVFVLVGCNGGGGDAVVRELVFRDVAGDVGLDFVHGAFRWDVSGDPVAMMGGGLCWIDYDRDGWLDLYVVNSYAVAEAGRWENEFGGLPTSALFRNNQGEFEDVSLESGTDFVVRGNGCVSADFNQDTYPDLYITTSRVNLLLWNNGDGTFSEGATEAGVDAYGWQTATAVGDMNGDGLPDLFVAGYVDINRPKESPTMGFPNDHFGRNDLLFINQGNDANNHATFREVGADVALEPWEPEYGLGALLTDIDGDNDLDLFVANDTNPNRLYENVQDESESGFHLVEIGAVAAVADTNSGMGVAGGDYDGDGQTDIFITNMGPQTHSLYRREGAGRFVDSAEPTFGVGQTGWGTSWFDADMDGDLDLFVANGGIPVTDVVNDGMLAQLYRNEAGRLVEWTEEVGLNKVGALLARGSAVADYDNDGDLDIAVGSIGGALTLLENEGTGRNWLAVAFESVEAGTIVTAVLPDGRELRRELFLGSSYLASEDMRVYFGLDSAETVTLIITLPDSTTTHYTNITSNQIWHLDSTD